jgi:hypothetical protein
MKNYMVESAKYAKGYVTVTMSTGLELRFPIADNDRLSRGTHKQLNNIEISPYGLHWPDLDENLSIEGIKNGDYGQVPKWHVRELRKTKRLMREGKVKLSDWESAKERIRHRVMLKAKG